MESVLKRSCIVVTAAGMAFCAASCGGEKTRSSVSEARTTAGAARSKLPSAYPESFWQTWQDGKAEVCTYELSQGGKRGLAVAVFSAGRFSTSRRAGSSAAGQDTVPAMKLSLIRHYAPGDGDMRTVHVALEPVENHPAGVALKAVYSAWNWTGARWRQLSVAGNRANLSWNSPEGDGQAFNFYQHQHGVIEDALPLCARRIAWPVLRLGQTGSYDLIPSTSTDRLQSDKGQPKLVLSLTKERNTTVTPAGSFRTHTFTAAWEKDGATWHVEADPPHRLVRWESKRGEMAVLLGSERMELSEVTDAGVVLQRLGVRQ